MGDVHFKPFVLESGGVFGVRAQEVCDLITFTKWALAHNKSRGPDSIPTDLADYYDHDERETNRMLHSSGPERRYMADHQKDIDQWAQRQGGRWQQTRGRQQAGRQRRRRCRFSYLVFHLLLFCLNIGL